MELAWTCVEKKMMTASLNRRHGGHHKVTEEEDDQGIVGKEIWRKNCGQQDSLQVELDEDGGGSTRQSWMETSGLWTMFHTERQGVIK